MTLPDVQRQHVVGLVVYAECCDVVCVSRLAG